MYYILLAIVDIGFFLAENWKELTATAIASGIGIILGKRIGAKLAVNQIMKLLGIEHKSKLERKVDWLIELERGRGNVWSGNTGILSNTGARSLKKLFSSYYTALSRKGKGKMKDFLTGKKKWLAFLLAVIVNGLNDTLGLGMDAETIQNITQGATGYIVVEGVLDLARSLTNHFKAKETKENDKPDIPIEPIL
jgi:hypothetical protein